MTVYKIVCKDGTEFFNENYDFENFREAMGRIRGIGLEPIRAERVELTDEEYAKIPATSESTKVWG